MAKDSDKQQAEDLELKPDKAGEVKGGIIPIEPGGGGASSRHVSVKHKTHHKKGGVQGPIRGMPHE